jgi:hypothetical protein
VEEEADRGAVVDGDAGPLAPPRADGTLDQALGRLFPVLRRRHDLRGLVVGDHVPDPVGGEDDELVPPADPPLRHLRRRDDAVVLDAVVAERARHGQPRRLPVRQPHAVHARLVREAVHAAVALPDALLLLCSQPGSTRQNKTMSAMAAAAVHSVRTAREEAPYEAGSA